MFKLLFNKRNRWLVKQIRELSRLFVHKDLSLFAVLDEDTSAWLDEWNKIVDEAFENGLDDYIRKDILVFGSHITRCTVNHIKSDDDLTKMLQSVLADSVLDNMGGKGIKYLH